MFEVRRAAEEHHPLRRGVPGKPGALAESGSRIGPGVRRPVGAVPLERLVELCPRTGDPALHDDHATLGIPADGRDGARLGSGGIEQLPRAAVPAPQLGRFRRALLLRPVDEDDAFDGRVVVGPDRLPEDELGRQGGRGGARRRGARLVAWTRRRAAAGRGDQQQGSGDRPGGSHVPSTPALRVRFPIPVSRPGNVDGSGPDTSPDRRRSPRRGRPHRPALPPTRTWNTASSPHSEQIAVSLSTCSARAMSDGSGSNGRPSNVTSSPATMTTSPRSARRPTTGTRPGPKNCASSIATMSVPSGTDRSMSSGDATARAGTLSPTCEASRSAPCRVSRAWPNTATCRPAISARRTRRSSSSVLPANIGPQTTSTRPIVPIRRAWHRVAVSMSNHGGGMRAQPLKRARLPTPVVLATIGGPHATRNAHDPCTGRPPRRRLNPPNSALAPPRLANATMQRRENGRSRKRGLRD